MKGLRLVDSWKRSAACTRRYTCTLVLHVRCGVTFPAKLGGYIGFCFPLPARKGKKKKVGKSSYRDQGEYVSKYPCIALCTTGCGKNNYRPKCIIMPLAGTCLLLLHSAAKGQVRSSCKTPTNTASMDGDLEGFCPMSWVIS